MQSGSDKVEAKNPVHSESLPSLAEGSDPTNVGPPSGKSAPVKEPGIHTCIFSHSQLLISSTDGKGKKVTKKPDIGKVRQKRQPSTTSDNKGKRKALRDDDGSEAVEDANEKITKPTKTKAQKSRTAAKEPRPADVEIDTEDDAAPKKKKMRKLNIFGPAKPDSLDWANQFTLVSRITVRTTHTATTLMPLFREVVAWTYQPNFRR